MDSKQPPFNIVAVQQRDIYALLEMSHTEMIYLLRALARCEISVNKEDPEDVHLEERFFSFYEQLNQLADRLKEQYGTPSNIK